MSESTRKILRQADIGNGRNVTLRALEVDDFDKGFLQLLDTLTEVKPHTISRTAFQTFCSNPAITLTKLIVVAENDQTHQIVGTASIFNELKFSRGLGSVGHIEDVVVHKECRGSSLGRLLIDVLTEYGFRTWKCYKIILDCSVENTKFYERCGYKRAEVQMRCDRNTYEAAAAQSKL
eukprot:PhF_6_TR4949/c0_g1_i2/m.7016/K00621/GNPNAT1, GNA1; glucosamine-phosphate N-acetyltransferase